MREIINKHWHILNINNAFGNVFKSTPGIAFRKNKSLKQIIGTNTIKDNQKLLKVKVAEADMRYFVRSQFSRSLVYKENFSLI